MSFGDYFKKLRISKSVTQKQIAEQLGKTTMLISGVETNKNKPFSISDLERIATYLKLSNEEYKTLLREAAKERGLLPPHMLSYVNDHDEAYQLLDVFIDRKMKGDSLKKILKYAEELENV